MAKKKEESKFSPLWFLGGVAAGIGAWLLFKDRVEASVTAGPTGAPVNPPLPVVSSPARYADLASVVARFGQVKASYDTGRMNSAQALAETEGLIAAANSFSLSDGEAASEAVAQLMGFASKIRGDMALGKNPGASMAGARPKRVMSARSFWN